MDVSSLSEYIPPEMVWHIAKVFIAAGIISFSSWLAGKQPRVAGFIMALPLATMIALAFNYVEFQTPTQSVKFAQSIFAAIPLSLLFFIPFLLASKLQWGFHWLYLSGLLLLAVGYFLHRTLWV